MTHLINLSGLTTLQKKIIDRVKVTESGCWEWQRSRNPKGYGKIGIRTNGKDKTWLAHRLSYTAFHGEIPDDMLVMHSCDRPSCCNPEHLSIGTAQDNTDDMVAKGRCVLPPVMKGESHPAFTHGQYVGGNIPPKSFRKKITEINRGTN